MPCRLPEPRFRDWLWLAVRKRRYPTKRRRPKWRAILQFEAMTAKLQTGDIAIDCGASDGQCTRLMAATGATVYAFEPDPHAILALKSMFRETANVHLMEQAVGVEKNRVPLYRSPHFENDPNYYVQASSLYASKSNVSATNRVLVDQIDLPAFIAALPRRVSILKLDIEGSEVPILEHLLDMGIASRIDCIFAEMHEGDVPELLERTIALRERIAREKLIHITLDWV
jgi:FkbM family methyltransferase